VLDGDAKFVRRGNLLSEWVKAVPKLVPRAVASVDVRSKHVSQCLSVHTAVSRHRCIAWGTCAGLGESAKTKGQANLQGISEGGEGSAPGNRSGMLLPSTSSTHCLLNLQPWAQWCVPAARQLPGGPRGRICCRCWCPFGLRASQHHLLHLRHGHAVHQARCAGVEFTDCTCTRPECGFVLHPVRGGGCTASLGSARAAAGTRCLRHGPAVCSCVASASLPHAHARQHLRGCRRCSTSWWQRHGVAGAKAGCCCAPARVRRRGRRRLCVGAARRARVGPRGVDGRYRWWIQHRAGGCHGRHVGCRPRCDRGCCGRSWAARPARRAVGHTRASQRGCVRRCECWSYGRS